MRSLSFVIRAYNEKDQLCELVETIREQDYPQELIELVVVDNGSTDGTADAAESLGATVVHLPQAEFSYPKSLNVGCEVTHNELIVIVSAHCLFWRKDSLEKAVAHFDDEKVAGVYGPLIPRRPYTTTQWLGSWIMYARAVVLGVRREIKLHLGILGNTNAIIRHALWQAHPFNEEWGMGAEDYEWARWAITQGYTIVRDPAFTVRHSHCLGFFDSIRQQKFWTSIKGKPRPFNQEELRFRKDIKRAK